MVFNNFLRSARNPIEYAFGRLKARWSILTRKVNLNLETVPKVILTCFILHNLCELHNDDIDENAVSNQVSRNIMEENTYRNIPDPVYSCTTAWGRVKLQEIP